MKKMRKISTAVLLHRPLFKKRTTSHSRRHFLLPLLFAAIAFSSASAQYTPKQLVADPVFTISPTSYDFGSITTGSTPSQNFIVTNHGKCRSPHRER